MVSMLDRERAIAAARAAAARVVDPEIPALSIADLGVLRDVRCGADGVIEIDITPTYSGCPAMRLIAHEVEAAVEAVGLACAGLEHRLDHAGGTRGAAPIGHRAAGAGRRTTRPVRRGRDRPLPALWRDRHRETLRVRLDRLQGTLALPRLRRAVRLLQVSLKGARA